MDQKVRKIKFINYFGYGLVDVIGSGGFTLTSAWLLYFYTTFCGLTLIQGASIFAIARIVDVIMSPTMGFITDNFHKTKLGRKFGRRRFFLLLAIPFVIIYSFIWVSGFSYMYYVLTYIGFEIVYSMILIPYDTLAAEMTSDFKLRTKLTSARMYIAQISAFIAAFLPGRLISYFGKESSKSFLYAGIIFTIAFIIALVFVYSCTWERSLEEIQEMESKEYKQKLKPLETLNKIYVDFFTTLKVKSFRAHLGMYLGGSVAQDVFNSVFTYFVVYALARGAVVASNLLGIVTAFQIVGVGLATFLTLKFNPSIAFRIQSGLVLVAFAGFLIAYGFIPNSMIILYVVSVIAGIGRGGIYCIPWNNYTFIADVDEIVSCDRREGIYAGFMTFLRKTSQALSIFLVGVILQGFNFVPKASHQPKEALIAMIVLVVAVPIVLTTIGIISSFKFKVTNESHDILKKEVKRLKDGGSKKDVTNETRNVVEDLTGLKYENLWGNNCIGYSNTQKYKYNAKNVNNGV